MPNKAHFVVPPATTPAAPKAIISASATITAAMVRREAPATYPTKPISSGVVTTQSRYRKPTNSVPLTAIVPISNAMATYEMPAKPGMIASAASCFRLAELPRLTYNAATIPTPTRKETAATPYATATGSVIGHLRRSSLAAPFARRRGLRPARRPRR